MEELLFDIDGTLFDTEKFGSLIRKRFIDIIRIEEEELTRANADYYADLSESFDFDPHGITEFLAQKYGVEKGKLDEVFWQDDGIYKECLFDDVESALIRLSDTKKLGIFSQGNLNLQARKLEASGIRRYFEEELIFIHKRKLTDEALNLLPRESTVVDDNHEVMVKIAPIVSAIWMNRRTDDKDPEVRTIHNLRELI